MQADPTLSVKKQNKTKRGDFEKYVFLQTTPEATLQCARQLSR